MLNRLMEQGKIIDVDFDYLTDSGVSIYRCYGRGTSTYWVRQDNLLVYKTVTDAYFEENGKRITDMNRWTATLIIESLRGHLEEIKNFH